MSDGNRNFAYVALAARGLGDRLGHDFERSGGSDCGDAQRTRLVQSVAGRNEAVAGGDRMPARAFAEQGLLDLDASGEPVDRNDTDDMASGDDAIALPSFRFVSTGNFVIDYGEVVVKRPAMRFRLVCTGDFNAGVLKTIQIDGKLFRPKSNEPWRF